MEKGKKRKKKKDWARREGNRRVLDRNEKNVGF